MVVRATALRCDALHQFATIIRCSRIDAGTSAATATTQYSLQQLYVAVAQMQAPVQLQQLYGTACSNYTVQLHRSLIQYLGRNSGVMIME